jgi:hypothetical protein
MKTFKDLKFKDHPLGPSKGIHAKMWFPDGSHISVIQGPGFYCTVGASYEVLSSRFHRKGGVRGWMSKQQITSHMKYIQNNPIK